MFLILFKLTSLLIGGLYCNTMPHIFWIHNTRSMLLTLLSGVSLIFYSASGVNFWLERLGARSVGCKHGLRVGGLGLIHGTVRGGLWVLSNMDPKPKEKKSCQLICFSTFYCQKYLQAITISLYHNLFFPPFLSLSALVTTCLL